MYTAVHLAAVIFYCIGKLEKLPYTIKTFH